MRLPNFTYTNISRTLNLYSAVLNNYGIYHTYRRDRHKPTRMNFMHVRNREYSGEAVSNSLSASGRDEYCIRFHRIMPSRVDRCDGS